MNYRFYYPDWNSRENICEDYPEIKEITKEPIAFWYGVGPKRTIRKTKHSIQRLLKSLPTCVGHIFDTKQRLRTSLKGWC